MPVDPGWTQDAGNPETLDLLLLGPGYGESLIARIPPGVLLVIDCFPRSGARAGCRAATVQATQLCEGKDRRSTIQAR